MKNGLNRPSPIVANTQKSFFSKNNIGNEELNCLSLRMQYEFVNLVGKSKNKLYLYVNMKFDWRFDF